MIADETTVRLGSLQQPLSYVSNPRAAASLLPTVAYRNRADQVGKRRLQAPARSTTTINLHSGTDLSPLGHLKPGVRAWNTGHRG